MKTYDFQAPLGEFGQRYPHYYTLRKLHLFMNDYAETLAPMDASFPAPQDIRKGDDSQLRWAYRSLGDSGFVFVNNYERLQNLTAKSGVQFDVCVLRSRRDGLHLPRQHRRHTLRHGAAFGPPRRQDIYGADTGRAYGNMR